MVGLDYRDCPMDSRETTQVAAHERSIRDDHARRIGKAAVSGTLFGAIGGALGYFLGTTRVGDQGSQTLGKWVMTALLGVGAAIAAAYSAWHYPSPHKEASPEPLSDNPNDPHVREQIGVEPAAVVSAETPGSTVSTQQGTRVGAVAPAQLVKTH